MCSAQAQGRCILVKGSWLIYDLPAKHVSQVVSREQSWVEDAYTELHTVYAIA